MRIILMVERYVSHYTIPDIDRAKYSNEYFFGSELLVYPITRKSKKGKSAVTVYLPQGKWTNFFDKQVYNGGQKITLTYGLDAMPVFIKENGIEFVHKAIANKVILEGIKNTDKVEINIGNQ